VRPLKAAHTILPPCNNHKIVILMRAFSQVRLHMKNTGWFSRPSNQQTPSAKCQRVAGGIGVAILLLMTGGAFAQNAASQLAAPATQASTPDGYSTKGSVDVGGHMINRSGSAAMYDTLVNVQPGPRVLGETFELRALPGNKHALVDHLKGYGTGFGGDPNSYSKLDFSKGKFIDFAGVFRRDRQYFDYDLLGNPNLRNGIAYPIGPSNAPLGMLSAPAVNDSPEMFNTVRRMTDTNLTILPLATFTYRFGYSQNVFEGPTMSPGYLGISKYNALLEQYQRNSSDEFSFGLDWKPLQNTKVTFEELVNHYKADSSFMLNPNGYTAQEADGTKVYLGNWDNQGGYLAGTWNATLGTPAPATNGVTASCNSGSVGTGNYTSPTVYNIFSPNSTPGGLPIINPACDVITSYTRTQPTRILTPTETLRLQSSSIKNVSMNGDFRYTLANSKLPSYYEQFQGLNGAIRSSTISGGYAYAHRAVVAADYAIVWQASKSVSIADQINFSNVQEPGYSLMPLPVTLSTPLDTKTSTGNETINYAGHLTPGVGSLPHGNAGAEFFNFLGERLVTNNLTMSWDVNSTTKLSLTYRYKTDHIAEGIAPATDPVSGTFNITGQGGVFNAAYRPTSNWEVNGTAELLWDDNVFTTVGLRRAQHYRIHTKYKPTKWAILSAAFTDAEKRNNTNNLSTQSGYAGPLDHVESSQNVSANATLQPNEHYGLDVSYAYTDVFSATNICFSSGSNTSNAALFTAGNVLYSLPGTATVNANGGPNLCPGSTTTWFGRDFQEAPTQYVSAALTLSPAKPVHVNLGYRLSSVSGDEFYNDARAVAGSMNSRDETPFAKMAWTLRPGLVWRAEYNFNGYTEEGGVTGAVNCSLTTSATASIVPCSTLPNTARSLGTTAGFTAPRDFRAHNVTLALHYEF